MALAMAVTVFVIALAYHQVIELFPSGGGGDKVATRLLGARAGLLSGAALLVDYALTIAISGASGADAVFILRRPATWGSLPSPPGRRAACRRSSNLHRTKHRA